MAELPTELGRMRVDRAADDVVVVAPDLVQQVAPADDVTGA
jgi:hypothetical protein